MLYASTHRKRRWQETAKKGKIGNERKIESERERRRERERDDGGKIHFSHKEKEQK